MADTRLRAFVEAALAAGKSREEIHVALRAAGWHPEQIGDGLAEFADVPFAVPVPRPRAHLSARDAFLYMLMFGALYVSAFNLGRMLFAFINRAFPLTPFETTAAAGTIRWTTASLIIAFPLFLWLAVKLSRELAVEPARRQSAIRRWLIYLTLLVAASFIVGDAITLVYSLLSGDTTLRFMLKVVVVGAITGVTFGYFLRAARSDGATSGP
jgi:hypothetical protein